MTHPETSNPGEKLDFPDEIKRAQVNASRLEWISIVVLGLGALLVFLVAGNSQAMKTAWVEDLLSTLPPITFLIALRFTRRKATAAHPYGYHRAVGIGHLIASVALTAVGLSMVYEGGSALLTVEHPSIGTVSMFGQTVWLGWLMIGVMVLTGWPPVVLGHLKLKYAKQLHDKVLYADADMNKADWMTALGTIIGIIGIGLGIWWLDGAVALFIAGSILYDGVTNLKSSLLDLMDEQALTYSSREPHPIAREINETLAQLPWVAEAGCRVRDQGHMFHVEAFVVPTRPNRLKLEDIEDAREICANLDWKVRDVVIAPIDHLSDSLFTGRRR